MTRPRHTRGFQKSARLTQWLGPANQGFVSVAGGGATLISTAAFEAPGTVMRSRGMISVHVPSTLADSGIIGAIGIAIVSTEAATAGVASLPEPFTDADWGGWFVWRSFAFRFEFQSTTGTNYVPWYFEIDSKAMRKFAPNETMVAVAESQAGAFEIFDGTRHLLKLP